MTATFSRRRLFGAAAVATALPAATSPVAFDGHSLLFNGHRELLVSGEMHYARAPRELWPSLLDRLPEDAAHPRVIANDLEKLKMEGFRHRFVLANLAAGEHRLDILAVALGMIKGDWQIAGPMDTERKGIWGEVKIDGTAIEGWQMRPGLSGERLRVHETPDAVEWSPAVPRVCTWFRTQILLSPDVLRRDADLRLNAIGLRKGMLFLNGRCLARYWLLAGNGYGADRGWHRIEEDGLSLGPAGPPTQQYYHVPRAWLSEHNSLLLFEEQQCLPDRVVLEARF